MTTDLHYLTIAEASAKLKARTLSPVELTEVFLKRIKALDGQLNSHILVLEEEAMAAARTAEAEIAAHNMLGRVQIGPWVEDMPAAYMLADVVVTDGFTGNVALPGSGSMRLHSDQALAVPPPWPEPLSMNVIWCVDDVHKANGATRYLPGSHRYRTIDDLPADAGDRLRGRVEVRLDVRQRHVARRQRPDQSAYRQIALQLVADRRLVAEPGRHPVAVHVRNPRSW